METGWHWHKGNWMRSTCAHAIPQTGAPWLCCDAQNFDSTLPAVRREHPFHTHTHLHTQKSGVDSHENRFTYQKLEDYPFSKKIYFTVVALLLFMDSSYDFVWWPSELLLKQTLLLRQILRNWAPLGLAMWFIFSRSTDIFPVNFRRTKSIFGDLAHDLCITDLSIQFISYRFN